MAGLASQQALDESTSALLTQAAAMDNSALAELASELAGFAAVLRAELPLRRVLTETTVDNDAKEAMVTQLIGGKVASASQKLIIGVVARRWSGGRALVDGLRRLSRTATFVQAERAGELDEVEDELFRFGRIVDANPEVSLLLDDPTTDADARADLVERLLAGKVHQHTSTLLTDLARDLGGRTYSHGVAELVTQAAERHDRLVATVTTAIALTAAEIDRLRAALAGVYAREVAVHLVTDPAVGGGLKVRVGDEVIDGSIAGRLDAIRQRLSQ